MAYTGDYFNLRDGTMVGAIESGWCVFSLTYRAPFRIDGVRYETVHHYLEASKALYFEDTGAHRRILRNKLSSTQSGLASNIKGFNPRVWAMVEERFLRRGTAAKLRQHPRIMELLVTGSSNAVLAHCMEGDKLLGTGLRRDVYA